MVILCHPAWVKYMRVIGHHWNVCIILYLLSGACNEAHKEDRLILPTENMRPHTPEARHLIWVIWEPSGFAFMLEHLPWHVFFTEGIKHIDWETNHLWNKGEQKPGLPVPPVKEEKHPGQDGRWERESYSQSCFSHLHFMCVGVLVVGVLVVGFFGVGLKVFEMVVYVWV